MKTATINYKTDEEMIEHREANAMAILLSAAGHAKSIFEKRLPDEECSVTIVQRGDCSSRLRAHRGSEGEAVQIQQSIAGRWEHLSHGTQPQRIRNLSLLSALVLKVACRYSTHEPTPAPAVPTHEVALVQTTSILEMRWRLVPLNGGEVHRQPSEDDDYKRDDDAITAAKAAARHLGVTVV